MNNHVPVPLILDTTVLENLARGDIGTIELIQGYNVRGQPLVVPVLAVTSTLLGTHTEDAVDAMHGLALFEHVIVAPLRDTEQAGSLASIIRATALTLWDAHVAAIADSSFCPILTYDSSRWQHASQALDNPLHIIEIADPDQ